MPPGAEQRRIGRHGSCQYIAAIDSHALIGTKIDNEQPLGLSWPLKAELRGLKRTASSEVARKDATSASQLATASSPYPLEALLGHGSFPALQFPSKLLPRMEPIFRPPTNCLVWGATWTLHQHRQHHTSNFSRHQPPPPISLSTLVIFDLSPNSRQDATVSTCLSFQPWWTYHSPPVSRWCSAYDEDEKAPQRVSRM